MGWALINFLGFHGGRLFEVGAQSNKQGMPFFFPVECETFISLFLKCEIAVFISPETRSMTHPPFDHLAFDVTLAFPQRMKEILASLVKK